MGSSSSITISMRESGLPLQEPNELCALCGARGTVGRAMRTDDTGVPTEIHRFCVLCWVENYARLRARWQEEDRLATEAWMRAPESAPPVAGGMMFESATWHATLEFVRDMRRASSHRMEAPSPGSLGRLAAEIAKDAADYVGDMPFEIELFIREHIGNATDAPEEEPRDPAAERTIRMQESADVMRDALLYSTTALAAMDDALNASLPGDQALLTQAQQCEDPTAMLATLEREADALSSQITELRNAASAEREQVSEWERRLMGAVAEKRVDHVRIMVTRLQHHGHDAERIETELEECLTLERRCREAIVHLRSRAGG